MRKLVTYLPLWLCLAALAVGAAGDRRMTVEESLAIKVVSGPEFSPDGKWIAYTVSEWDRKENRRVSHVHLVTADGARTLRLTNGDKGESAPQWSPDGSRVAFLAERGEKEKGNQVWSIPAAGGEAEKLTSEESGVSAFRWSPDGRRLAFVTRDTPPDKAEREKKKKDKFDAVVVDQDYRYAHLWTLDVESKEKKRLTQGDATVAGPQWSPDGKWIAYTVSQSGAQESSFIDISDDRNTDIFVVGAEGGPPRQLTSNPGPDGGPQWSPDGKWIAYTASPDPRSWAAKSEVMLVAAGGGAPRNTGWEAGGELAWAPDSVSLYFTREAGVYNAIVSAPVTVKGEARQVAAGSRVYGQIDVSADGKQVAFTATDSRAAADIWVQPPGGREARQVTRANPQLKGFAVAETEVIKWKGPENLDIEGLLVKPLGYEAGKRYPLILQIHGGPYGKFGDTFNSRAQIFAAHGYALLMPNPRGSTGYGNEFTVANLGDWGGKDFQDIMAGVDAAIARGVADPEKLVVMGGSYGGFMTFWTITQTDRFKAAIGHAGISDWYSFHGQSDIPGLMEYGFRGHPWTAAEGYRKYSPMTYVDRVKTPLLITHGEQDRRVTIAQGEQYYRALKKRGVEVVFVRYPREGHGIQEPNHQIDLVGRQLAWFDSHLGITRPKAVAATENK